MALDRDALDGNAAAARIAYALSEVIAIYPITPSSPMGELADQWASESKPNLWGTVPHVFEMQSEGGVAGAVHGALTTGGLATTFTASQGLLLMLPNLYKMAGELTPVVFHVAARSVASQALSIFGDHSDVMAARATGCAMLCSSSVQEAMDLALVAHAAALKTRLPFLHFFDGFRTSHEIQKIDLLGDGDIRALIDDADVQAHRRRGLNPDRPSLRGTAQNPDVFFQARESVNPFYEACPAAVEKAMAALAGRTGRGHRLFDYIGDPKAERVLVLMGSGCGAAEEAVERLNRDGAKTGLVKVRLYRPFSAAHLLAALPKSARKVAVLDRTKEPGSSGEPLYLDVLEALAQDAGRAGKTAVIGGRYGLSSKEFTPAMAAGVFAELGKKKPKNKFTVGIRDDVTGTSLDYDLRFATEAEETRRAVFYGLGSDGTVGANKNTIKILAERTDFYTQGYFVYDSKKSGAVTISHLRFGPKPIRSSYLISRAGFVACHQDAFLDRIDVLKQAGEGGVFLLNTTAPPGKIFDRLPREVLRVLKEKKLRFFIIDAYRVAREAGLGPRINTVMQVCYFHIEKLLPDAIEAIREGIRKTYGAKSEAVVKMNFKAVEDSIKNLHEVPVPADLPEGKERPPVVGKDAPDFVKRVTTRIMAGEGDELPVSAFPPDGTYPVGTARFEKRNIAQEIPAWDEAWCIQCNKCAIVCPHAAIRVKAYPQEALKGAPGGFVSVEWRGREFPKGTRYTVQAAPEDCTGCGLCVEACPAKNKTEARLKAINMAPKDGILEREKANLAFFLDLPEADRRAVERASVKGSQLLEPLFEFSGACAGCGETPYLKLLTQLFGDRMLAANATGCSSIYGGNLPTTPWTTGKDGRGPAWSNSLFEDNAEFGLGYRLTLDKQKEYAAELMMRYPRAIGGELIREILDADQSDEAKIAEQRLRVAKMTAKLKAVKEPGARELIDLADTLVRRSVWIIGGDGWAYDIGYGGLDHVLCSGKDVNVLVLDTEVYSNTGGQASKATPRGAVAKFAAAGKSGPRKDLAALAMSYGGVYVARIALGAGDTQTVRAFLEAESYPGPSLIIAYSHCIAHGINMTKGMEQQKLAVQSGYWPLLRYDPRRAAAGEKPLQVDSKPPSIPFKDYAYRETRYRMLSLSLPERAKALLDAAQKDIDESWRKMEEGG